jgi:hypothetical protein
LSKPITKPSILPAKREFPSINSFFDGSVLIARRFTELLSEIEPAVLRLFLLFHLVFDLGVVFLIIAILGAVLIWTIAHS